MKTIHSFIFTVYIFLFVCGSAFAIGESTISVGGESAWRNFEYRVDVAELRAVRPFPVLALSCAAGTSVSGYHAASGVLGNFSALTDPAFDLSISFDEGNASSFRDALGNYSVSSSGVQAAGFARSGTGAALFENQGSVVIRPQSANALFAPGSRIGDFTIEFWLYPMNLENGEQILSWVSSNGSFASQRIHCTSSRNRLHWSFVNFFASSAGTSHKNIEFSGSSPVIPKTWSHHLVRFDAATGMVEYVVNGVSEEIVYATPSGREGGNVYTPITGNGYFSLGERFTGLIDEFKIHNVFAGKNTVQKYSSAGRAQSRAIDLGNVNSSVVRVDVSGGRISGTANEYRENGRFRFSDDTEMHFFIRSSDNPYLLNNSQWVSFTPGSAITSQKGRYVQFAVDFYPSADGEASPYLEQLKIVYMAGEPPMPPRNLTAVACDGEVVLRWRSSPNANTAGYLVYYSPVRGELFGTEAQQGVSPIDAGNSTNIVISGLKNGTLYYFKVAAYDLASGSQYNVGEFSGEVTARPLAGLGFLFD